MRLSMIFGFERGICALEDRFSNQEPKIKSHYNVVSEDNPAKLELMTAVIELPWNML